MTEEEITEVLRMSEAKLSSLRINNVELNEITINYEKSQVLNNKHFHLSLFSMSSF